MSMSPPGKSSETWCFAHIAELVTVDEGLGIVLALPRQTRDGEIENGEAIAKIAGLLNDLHAAMARGEAGDDAVAGVVFPQPFGRVRECVVELGCGHAPQPSAVRQSWR